MAQILWDLSSMSPVSYILLAVVAIALLFVGSIFIVLSTPKTSAKSNGLVTYARFFYASFLKPHTGDGTDTGQQAALESFYKAQADVYDATRKKLLRGREDMLGLVAAQLKYKSERGMYVRRKPIWVDIGGGTGYNIEAMQAYVDVPTFFEKIFLVDLSPSLLQVARRRFSRLGWDVEIVCQDARTFRLEDYMRRFYKDETMFRLHYSFTRTGADLVTMSYSLSMIPDYYCVLDSLPSLLATDGTIGVVDFYVQSIVELSGRTYTGGSFNRHVTWIGRVFWRAWFDVDRVGLEGARRDYLEYRFGTLKSVDERNYLLGGIPYYIFLGTHRGLVGSDAKEPNYAQNFIETLDASCTESPYLSPQKHRLDQHQAVEKTISTELRSKAYQCAVVNLSSNLPLPSMFYQNSQRRIYYDDQLQKHTQFNNEYIYAFTWEDPRADHRLLKIRDDDVVLCVTSAGDNVLDYLYQASPRRVHAVDLNPNQNHLLELKVAALQSLPYLQVWKLFGEGRFPNFREVLISKLSPHLSSQACQYWLSHADTFDSSHGLHAIKLIRWLFRLLGLSTAVKELCNAKTLREQQEIWPKIRRVLLSKPLHWAVVSTEWWAWKAAGVPPAQRNMIVSDQAEAADGGLRGEAIWEYMVNTFDPVAQNTLISDDNYFYLLCLQGKYSQRCHPQYLSPRAHRKLSQPGAFDGLRIHTDELQEVIARIAMGTLSHAVIMDSMDWFEPKDAQAQIQIQALYCALKHGGKVLLRSAGLRPWYIALFETNGFTVKRVGTRLPGSCIDRVNMYASAWICTKREDMSCQDTKPVTTATRLATTVSRSSIPEDVAI
ncbi:MAG: hypothetical protein Q9195_006499 [Heterodermia aff. obscurata]